MLTDSVWDEGGDDVKVIETTLIYHKSAMLPKPTLCELSPPHKLALA